MTAALGPYLVAAALLAGAGVAKAAHPADTARALAAMGAGGWASSARVVRGAAVIEAVLGVVALARPRWWLAALVAMSYGAFTVWVLVARSRGGSMASCGCFGRPDTAPTAAHAVVTAGAGVAAAAMAPVAGRAGWLPHALAGQPWHGGPLLFGVAVATGLAYLVLVRLARLEAVRSGVEPPR